MHRSILNINSIKNEIEKIENLNKTKIIAISKTFPIEDILPLIEYGHLHFGENKVQEAVEKWSKVKNQNKTLKLHFVGKLQSNKVKFVIPLFDYIHSLDNLKLAEKIAKQQTKIKFKPKIFVQINIGNEPQKGGILVDELDKFINICLKDLELNIIGLMCLPPNDDKTENYFIKMKELNKKYGFKELSMGMSNDYKLAIQNESSFLRIGTKIFGKRVK
jgi:pyridoxal phosphate enzyme (YggS family)